MEEEEKLKGPGIQHQHLDPNFEGTGAAFYRCVYCHSVVGTWDIKKGGCPDCGGTRIVATNLRWWEKIIQILKHPAIWRWPDA